MPKVDWERIKAIIRRDATLMGKYANGKGGFCVLGGLADAAGIKLPLVEYNTQRISFLDDFPASLTVSYGLTLSQLVMLQECNDSYIRASYRRKALIALVDELAS